MLGGTHMFKCPFDWSKQPRTGRTRTFWVFEISVSGGGHAPGGGHGPDGVETRLVVGVDVLDGVLPEVFGKVDLWRVHQMFSRILNLRNLNKSHEIYCLFWSVLYGISFNRICWYRLDQNTNEIFSRISALASKKMSNQKSSVRESKQNHSISVIKCPYFNF